MPAAAFGMPATAFGLWALNLLLDTVGQLAFKAAAIDPGVPVGAGWVRRWQGLLRQRWLWVGVACYCIEFLTWLAFLSLVPLAQALLLASVNIVAIMLAGRWVFGERLDPLRSLGIVMIAAGVALVGLGARP